MDNDYFMNVGIDKAIQHNVENGIEIGTAVAHRSHPLTLELVKVDDEFAYCELPNDPTLLMFPVNEIFSVKVAGDYMIKAKLEHEINLAIGAIVGIVQIENIEN